VEPKQKEYKIPCILQKQNPLLHIETFAFKKSEKLNLSLEATVR